MAQRTKQKDDPLITGYVCGPKKALCIPIGNGRAGIYIQPGERIPPLPASRVEAMLAKGQIEEIYAPEADKPPKTGKDTVDPHMAEPKKALTIEECAGMDLAAMNLAAAERGFKGGPFEDEEDAIAWLTTNVPVS